MNRLGSANGIAVSVGGVAMRLHPAFATQNWETVEYPAYRAFAGMLRPGDVVYDVGAHIGTYTIIARKGIGPGGCVIAYEPHAFTRRHLERHLRWNGAVEGTVVRDACCGAEVGQADFYCLPERADGMSGLIPVDGFHRQIVDVTTLDREVATLGMTPSVLKIDVEGAEWDVLRGAEQTLRRARPRISLSLHPHALAQQGSRPGDVLAWLHAVGYGTEVIARDHEIHVVARAT